MASLTVRFELPDTHDVSAMVLDLMAEVLSKALVRSIPSIRLRVGEIAAEAIRAGEEYQSLIGGKLRHELGVVDARPILEGVLRNIADNVIAKSFGARRVGTKIEGGLLVEVLTSSMEETESVDGSFTSEHGFDIPWLNWLTTSGDKILVSHHRFEAGHGHRSRTDDGIMIRPGTWRIPPEFSGTAENNWLTRALADTTPLIGNVMVQELGRNI